MEVHETAAKTKLVIYHNNKKKFLELEVPIWEKKKFRDHFYLMSLTAQVYVFFSKLKF